MTCRLKDDEFVMYDNIEVFMYKMRPIFLPNSSSIKLAEGIA